VHPECGKGACAAGGVAGLGAAAAMIWGGYQVPVDLLVPAVVLNLAVGWSFIGVGVIAWARRPDSRSGVLMVAVGFAWLVRIAGAVDDPAAFVVGAATLFDDAAGATSLLLAGAAAIFNSRGAGEAAIVASAYCQ